MDKETPEYLDGRVKVHPIVKTLMKEYGEGGWIASTAPFEIGGQQLPLTLSSAGRFVFAAANYSASVYPFLSAGAAHLIEAFASRELIETYVPRKFEGKWQGTMALTEPQAGSSLSDITTSAAPTATSEPNDLNVAGIFHKLGYRGAPITQLSMGEQNDCRGWLVGEPHKGLSYMFQMMNETRIDVGLSAAAISSAGLLRLPGICPGKDPGPQARR